MSDSLAALKARIATITDLRGAASLLQWDQEVMMPTGGSKARSDQMATLRGLAHEMISADETGRLLEAAEAEVSGLDPDSHDARLVRYTRREYDHAVKLPVDLVKRRQAAISRGMVAWRRARAESKFSLFQSDLSEIVAIHVEMAGCLQQGDNPYDALLDQYEPGMNCSIVREVFGGLRPPLVALVKAISESGRPVDASLLKRRVLRDAQMAFNRQVVAEIGYSFQHGRLDLSTHPFTSASSYLDARLTTRFDEDNPISGLMSSVHEAGHGMHRQNLDEGLYRSNIASSPAQAIAESISRLYENNLGRSRAFWRYLFPRLRAAFTPTFDGVDGDEFYRALNEVKPSLIRVEADEVTYGLHIILRFELEDDLINGRVQVEDLPAVLNERMENYLGVRPHNDAEGVLQDIHWAMGYYGYFPDYLLGSIWAVQLWQAMEKAQPDIESRIERGDFAPVLAWLREAVLQHGVKFTLPELSERITGGPLAWQPYMGYLERKYRDIYALQP